MYDQPQAIKTYEPIQEQAIKPGRGGSLGQVGTSPNIPKSTNGRSEIATELSEQDKALEALGQMIEALEIKLQPVLMPQPPDNNCESGRPCASPIASCINANTCRIRAAIDRVRQLHGMLAI